MCAQPLVTTGIVLDRAASGDNWTRLTLFSAEHGTLACLQRIARRAASTSPPLDLFDETRLVLESRNEGRTWFVREAVPLRRRTGLGASYDSLRAACRFARVLTENPLHEESRPAVHALLERALDAWEAGTRPDAVYFKSLYLLARDEGYPVREEWERRLAHDDRTAVQTILREPAAGQTTGPADTQRLTGALEDYLRHSNELRFD